MYRCDIRPCNMGFPTLQATTLGVNEGCLLPVTREVQGCDQHGQHSRRGNGGREGSGTGQKGEQRVGRKLYNVSRQAIWQMQTLMQMPL